MIQLQPFTRNDYDRLIAWIDSVETLMQFAGPAFSFPLTAEQLDASLADEKRAIYKVVETESNAVIGHAEIYRMEKAAHLCRILIGNEEKRGKGVGSAVVAQLLRVAFEERRQPLATLNVFDWNTAAIRCYEKAGFRINPNKIAERTVNGRTWKALNMTLHKEKWDRLQEERTQKSG